MITMNLLAAASSSGGGGNAFGLAWEKFLAQVLLFLIVYMILKKFAFGPIMAVLEERRKRRSRRGRRTSRRSPPTSRPPKPSRRRSSSDANARAEGMINEARESAEAL